MSGLRSLHKIETCFMCLACVFIDELEDYHANRTTNWVFCTTSKTEGEVGPVKLV